MGTGLIKVVRKTAVLVSGSLLLAVGVVMLFLPAPGSATILAGLGVLSSEYTWARRWLKQGKTLVASRSPRAAFAMADSR